MARPATTAEAERERSREIWGRAKAFIDGLMETDDNRITVDFERGYSRIALSDGLSDIGANGTGAVIITINGGPVGVCNGNVESRTLVKTERETW